MNMDSDSSHSGNIPVSLKWIGQGDGHLVLLDQTRLPGQVEWLECRTVDSVIRAIQNLSVRGAPLIGIAGAYGLVVAAGEAMVKKLSHDATKTHLSMQAGKLAAARPTAVNLAWAVGRTLAVVESISKNAESRIFGESLLAEALAIHAEDRRLCESIGQHGAALLPEGDILTHCNTGSLATGGDGTALCVITTAWAQGRRFEVYADETRPLFQGARLTAWELVHRGIPVTVLVDSAAASLLKSGRIGSVIVGADRITASGDVANKIGTYGLAILAKAHGVPFFVAAPSSTFDLATREGSEIQIEQRHAEEVTVPMGIRVAPQGAKTFNPAFDVTPADLIHGIITEHGLICPVTRETILRGLESSRRPK